MGLPLCPDDEDRAAYTRFLVDGAIWLAKSQGLPEDFDISSSSALRERRFELLDFIVEGQQDLDELLDELPGTDDDDEEDA
jgi:hypothetical protein